MRTINDLNQKVWYRLIKVIYLLLFLFSIIIANGIIISDGIARIDYNRTFIYCNGGDKRVLNAKQAGVYFFDIDSFKNGFDYKNYFENNKYDIEAILLACYDTIPSEDIYVVQRAYEIIGFKDNPRQHDEDYFVKQLDFIKTGYKSDAQKASFLDWSIHLFDIKPIYSYNESIKYFFIANFSIIICFEILRRIFYYIILGSLKPKRKI